MSLADESLLDSIYEVAHIPELWPNLLDRLSSISEAWGGMLFTATPDATRWTSSQQTEKFFDQFLANGWMAKNPLVERGVRRNHSGFLTDLDLFTTEELDNEPMYADMRRLGGGWHLGTAIAVPNGDALVVNIERRYEHGPFSRAQAERLDLYRPHLSRAALLAARYTQARYETTVGDLEALGLAAAAVSFKGRLLACNGSFLSLMPAMFQDAPSRLAVSHSQTHKRVHGYLEQAHIRSQGASIAFPAQDENPPAVIHLVPVQGSARDVFAHAACLLVVTFLKTDRSPNVELVQGLFDLTPSEARVAEAIARGIGTRDVAAKSGVSDHTIRTQLRAVFLKTGTSKQAELAALLNGISFDI